jgi:hypothetical protein
MAMLKYSLIIALSLFSRTSGAGDQAISLRPVGSVTRFFSGEVIEEGIQVEGLPESGSADIYWQTQVGPAVIEKGQAAVRRGENNTGVAKVELDLPEVKRQTVLTWLVELVSGGNPLKKEAIQYRLFPRTNPEALKDVLQSKEVGIYDPRGKLKKIFQIGGVDYLDLANQVELDNFNGDLLLIGPGAIKTPYSGLFDIIGKKGPEMEVVCFRQTVLPREMPLPLELLSGLEAIPGKGIIMAPGHPIFSGLDESDFQGWRGDSASFFLPMNKPFWGNYRSLMDLRLVGEIREKRGSLLLEAFSAGKKMIFCQLPICTVYREEPVAGILFENLIRYSITPLGERGAVAFLSSPGSDIAGYFQKLGLSASLNPVDFARFDRVILVYDRESKEYISREGINLIARLEGVLLRGGKIIILGLEPDSISSLDRLLPEGLGLEQVFALVPEGAIKRDSPLFRGIADCEWTECIGEAEEFFEDKPVYEITLVSSEKGWSLTTPPFICQLPSRKGTIIISQWPFFRQEKDKASLRVLCQFLTNLGLRLKKNEEFLQGVER